MWTVTPVLPQLQPRPLHDIVNAAVVPLLFLIIRAVLSLSLLPRLRAGDGDVPPAEELHAQSRGRILLCLRGGSRNRPRVSNGATAHTELRPQIFFFFARPPGLYGRGVRPQKIKIEFY